MKNDIKIKIVAIAKDEAAYLPEWIFHHLYFGVDAIDIYINRTTDNSIDVLKKIQRRYHQVNFYSADWVDMLLQNIRSHLQFIVYAKAFHDEKESGEFTHIFFIDVDEFWVHKDLKTTLPDFVQAMSDHASISFPWFNMLGEEVCFNHMECNVRGVNGSQVKSIIHLGSDIRLMGQHIPFFDKKIDLSSCKLPDGNAYLPDNQYYVKLHSSEIDKDQDAFIIHRLMRSEEEYVSMLRRQRPLQNFPFKDNRFGFNRTHLKEREISFPSKAYSDYQVQRNYFFQKIDIETELDTAKKFIQARFENAVRTIDIVQPDKAKIIKQIFKGVTHQDVLDALEKYYKRASEVNKD